MSVKKNGRPAHKPTSATKKIVETLASFGVPQADIGKTIGVNHQTLRKYYGDLLEKGELLMLAKVYGRLFEHAMQRRDPRTSLTACQFIGKTRGGLRETNVQEHVGKDGKAAIEVDNLFRVEFVDAVK